MMLIVVLTMTILIIDETLELQANDYGGEQSPPINHLVEPPKNPMPLESSRVAVIPSFQFAREGL